MKEKLLPCPFCGGEPKLRTHRSGEDSMECYVECPSCEVRTTYYEDAYAPVADARGAWNRRTPAPSTHVVPFAMSEAEIRQWIEACNHEPARATLRHYLALRVAGEAEHAKPPCLQAEPLSDEPPLTMRTASGVSLASPAAPSQHVRVKPLDWKPLGKSFEATTPVGEFHAQHYSEIDGEGWTAVYSEATEIGDFPTADAAKAAAQAEYERRILSALATTEGSR